MSIDPQVSADAAGDSYTNLSQSQVGSRTVYLDGQKYQVFGYRDDPVTGFHGTAYWNQDTGSVVITYRGTDPNHLVTTIQDGIVDATMVRDRVNPQEAAASAFTQEMIDKAQKHGIDKDLITVAGHSLGGTLAEIEAAKFGLSGSTYNAYGAADLGYNVPEGGSTVTDYVMAGDVVSAASHHYGRVVTLASPDDLKDMQAGRYLDAPAGAQPPNPFLAMSLGDHSITDHFIGQNSALKPETLAQYEKNYTDHKAAIDAYRNDVYRERGELSQALRQAQGHGAHAQLPPDIQKQLDEYLTVKVDPVIQKKVEQNSVVQGAKHGLQDGANTLRAGGQFVQSQNERVATTARATGHAMGSINPFAPLAGAAIGEAAHLQGQAANAVGDFAANRLQEARQAIEHGAHDVAQAVDATIHSPQVQAGAMHAANHVVDAYQTVENTAHAAGQTYDRVKQAVSHGMDVAEHTAVQARDNTRQALSHGVDATEHAVAQTYDSTRQAISHGIDIAGHTAAQAYDGTRQAASHGVDAAEHVIAQAYDNTRQAFSHGVEATEHALGQTYDRLTHPGQWFGQGAPPAPTSPSQQPRTNPTAESPYTRDDPRHAASPNHALYRELHERIPDASEKRLLQFTAACHAGGITQKNIGQIGYDEHRGVIYFMPASEPRPPVAVDVKTPSPDPQHSIQQIQQANQLQAHVRAQSQGQGAQIGQ